MMFNKLYRFVDGLFDNTFSSLGCTVPNESVIREHLYGKDLKGSGYGLI